MVIKLLLFIDKGEGVFVMSSNEESTLFSTLETDDVLMTTYRRTNGSLNFKVFVDFECY